ncbi:unnamed protein product [Hermetia illucens]|uniref:Uncharacterized protein n=1 Tax=Hermetia illucens TaxID=343691 RepID=A0A7R8YQR1_HERIL|nr:unnamed protein product [Hermetia illucens]
MNENRKRLLDEAWSKFETIDNEIRSLQNVPISHDEDEEYIQELIERFWKLDEVDYAQSALTVAEKRCEAHFAQHNTRRSEGRFVVRLPFVDNPSTLEESTQMTLNRFFALEKRIAKNTVIKAQYVEFMNEYESLGHMTRIDPKNVLPAHYFILHHYVLKPDTSTT